MVPQFIEVEDKILGPITTRQFVELLAGGLICFIMYRFLSFAYFAVGAVFVIGVDVVLAFAKVNGRPVHYFLLNFLQTAKRPKLRIWNREAFVRQVQEVESGIQEKVKEIAKKAPVSGSRLRDLSIVVNTGGVYQGEDSVNESFQ
jgi:hypothetical protein